MRLTETATEALKKHLARQLEQMECLGDLYEDQGLVFATQRGTLVNPSNLSGPIRKFFDTSHGHAAATDEDASGSCSARRERSRSRSWRVNFQANGSAACS